MKRVLTSNRHLVRRPHNEQQSQVKVCLRELADKFGSTRGMDRREFLKTSSGMAATFLAMNSVYGKVFDVTETEAADIEMANNRAGALRQQFIFDVETYFLRDDYPIESLGEVLKRGLIGFYPFSDPDLRRNMKRDLGVELMPFEDSVGHFHADMSFENYVRQIYLNSDTSLTVLNGIPFDNDSWEFLNNAQIAEAAEMVNITAGQTRMLSQAVVTPGQPGWMQEVDRALAERPPASWKLYTIGDPLSAKTKYPFWLDDEKLMYPFYEKAAKAGIVNMCVHKGLMPRDYRNSWAGVWKYQTARDLVKAAADWPQLNFIIYNGAFRALFDHPRASLTDFETTGRIDWCSDLAEIPAQNGATNVYAETGLAFESTAMLNPRLATAILGIWIKGLGASNVVWGTTSVVQGSPQWQIEAMRRLEIAEDMQEKYGFAPLGGADGAVKQQIFGLNSARLYNLNVRH